MHAQVAKRKGRLPKAAKDGAALEGQRILVKFEVPDVGERLYIGTVTSYDEAKVKHDCVRKGLIDNRSHGMQ